MIKKQNHLDTIYIDEFLETLEVLGINQREASKFCGVSANQFTNWKKKGRMPQKNFWAFQNQLTIYSVKELIKKLVVLKIIDKEFLGELMDESI